MSNYPEQAFPEFSTIDDYRRYIQGLVIPQGYSSFACNMPLEDLVGKNSSIPRLMQAFRAANSHGFFIGPCKNSEPALGLFCGLYRAPVQISGDVKFN